MANRRSSPQTSTASSPPLARKKYPLRRSPPARKRGGNSRAVSTATHPPARASISSPESRPVLVPLQPNLRRLPSRTTLAHKGDSDMRVDADAKVGTKRKRVATTNENSVGGGRTTRGAGRPKRLKRNSGQRMDYTSDESDASEMEIDHWNSSRNSESDGGQEENEDGEEKTEDESDDDDDQSSDDYLINSAQPNQLLRLRKDELVRLYSLAGLCDDAEQFTKSEIVDAIITARDDVASLPPSSPPGQGNSSDYSSDDGHFGDTTLEESRHPSTRTGLSASLRRRATTNDYGGGRIRPGKLKGRSLSMGTLHGDAEVAEAASQSCKRNSKKASQNSSGPRRRTLSRPSPVASTSAAAIFHSPPATRTRSRKVSAEVVNCGSISTPIANLRKTAKGKGKQVEFDDQVQPKTPSTRTRGRSAPSVEMEEESDLTELEDLEQNMRQQPSPRRLRSKDRAREPGIEELPERRITPMRKAKGRVVSLKESDTDELMDEEEEEGSDEEEVEEVDELITTATPSPVSSRVDRTPMRRRLRSGQKDSEQASASDGDDEQEDEQDEAGDDEADDEDDEATIAVEPRRLRNGKIVGEDDDAEMEVIEEDVNEEEADDEGVDVEEVDIDAEGDTEEEEQEEDEQTIEDDEVDLTIATTKTLVRLRRDDLVRLCEARDLEPAGTKPQLAEALLQWRDRQEISSKSSTGTIRPPSTVRRARRRLRDSGDTATPPVPLRSDHVLPDEPATPQVPQEPELELDLEDLGLEDREIPPEKLQKLEKIGSGGFKDVFIGKFKGRKIAISEFRGQLTSMDIKELKLLGGFDHPNIVRFHSENTKEVPVMIVSELCSNGDLFDYIRNVNPPSLHKVLMIMLDVARGVEYLHLRKPSVIHRDCKSSNILITSRGTAKIADFGLAKVKQSTRSMVRSLVGTVNWQAPELWHAHPKYNHKVDVFSCAMVYWEMLQWHQPTKKFPWEGMNEHAIYEITFDYGLKKQWCPEIVALIEKMWAHEHEQRPTMSEVVTELEDLVKCY
ncbi:hypothetical protein BDZ89DRAFT_1082154 [Hymenopellis radicata]|nr:hypothetical protein BDZ89DRAFT_1082154 [Hymenopellis radicata]